MDGVLEHFTPKQLQEYMVNDPEPKTHDALLPDAQRNHLFCGNGPGPWAGKLVGDSVKNDGPKCLYIGGGPGPWAGGFIFHSQY